MPPIKTNKKENIAILSFLLSLGLLFSFTANIQADPYIDSMSGTIVDGESVSISGSGFGTNALEIEWLGGAGGYIESGSDGDEAFRGVSARNGWYTTGDTISQIQVEFSNADAHSHNNSLLSQYDASHYKSGFRYSTGDAIDEIYVTWWAKIDLGNIFNGQWKLYRLTRTSNVVDAYLEIMSGIWHGVSNNYQRTHLNRTCEGSTNSRWLESESCLASRALWLTTNDFPREGEWARLELYAIRSTPNIWDGEWDWSCIREGAGTYNTNRIIMTRQTSEDWLYFWWQNYLGNDVRDGSERVYIDDPYIQLGSRARVEIGDASTWDSCTHREIQIPTNWSDGSITFTVNQGSFQNEDTAYLFAVDSDGTASGGYLITFTGTAPGDINDDEVVNIQDIQACVNHILGIQNYSTADVNGDESVNVLDVQEIVNIILGG